ncbi:MAG: GNAT family N-acetyltransferase, partial [Firmicutes bacterium]|nr:GNAT family N-acetyltransferase [Bacillota bacterium]
MIRYAEAPDTPRVRALWELGFGNEEPYTGWYFRQVYRSGRTLLYEAEGRLCSSLQLAPYELSLKGQAVAAAYVVGVVTDTVCRGRGYASALLRRALRDLAAAGYELALLYTDIPGFYEPLGFTCCYGLRRLRFDAAGTSAAGWVKQPPTSEAIAHCQRVYKKMCTGFDGYVLRTAENWRNYISDWLTDGRNGLYLGPDAYFLTEYTPDGLSLKEIGYASPAALRDALRAAAALARAGGGAGFSWDAPELAPLPPQPGESRRPWVMARLTGGDGL